MIKFVLALAAAAAIAAPALAEPQPQATRFTRDGTTYVATINKADNGDTLIAGYAEDTGRAFALRVANGQVTGKYGDTRVSYQVPARGEMR